MMQNINEFQRLAKIETAIKLLMLMRDITHDLEGIGEVPFTSNFFKRISLLHKELDEHKKSIITTERSTLKMFQDNQEKIARRLYELSLFDAADLDDVIITTSPTGDLKNTHQIKLASGTFNGKIIEGKDTGGHNIHLPVKYIVDIN